MAFENKGQYMFDRNQGYAMISGYNKMLRDKKISSETELKQAVPQTAPNKQSGFGRF